MSIMQYRSATSRRAGAARSGFTIIEVLIVLAIAGLILVVVLFAVPALQRNSRNYSRKRFIESVGTQLQQYYTDNHKYPVSGAEGTAFVNNYLADIKGYYNVEFWDVGHPHSYVPPLDAVAIQYGHWCNRYGDGDAADDPIAGTDLDTHAFVVWSSLEPTTWSSKYFCLDNHR